MDGVTTIDLSNFSDDPLDLSRFSDGVLERAADALELGRVYMTPWNRPAETYTAWVDSPDFARRHTVTIAKTSRGASVSCTCPNGLQAVPSCYHVAAVAMLLDM